MYKKRISKKKKNIKISLLHSYNLILSIKIINYIIFCTIFKNMTKNNFFFRISKYQYENIPS